MTTNSWTILTALAACIAAFGSVAAAWALYHTRMLDCNFMAEPSFSVNSGRPVMSLVLTRSKAGGPHGRLVGIEVDPKFKVQVAARVYKLGAYGAIDYGGETWEAPVFSNRAECDIPFSPSSTSFVAAFWVAAKEQTEFRAVLIFEYKRATILASRVDIFARPIPIPKTLAPSA